MGTKKAHEKNILFRTSLIRFAFLLWIIRVYSRMKHHNTDRAQSSDEPEAHLLPVRNVHTLSVMYPNKQRSPAAFCHGLRANHECALCTGRINNLSFLFSTLSPLNIIIYAKDFLLTLVNICIKNNYRICKKKNSPYRSMAFFGKIENRRCFRVNN